MRLFRYGTTLFFGIRSLKNVVKSDPSKKSVIVAALVLSLAASAFVPITTPEAHAARNRVSSVPFLTLPFAPTDRMSILSGWYYSSSGGLHKGIDYINGGVDGIGSWRT